MPQVMGPNPALPIQALPANNTSGLSNKTLQFAHAAAPVLIVGIDMLLASAASGKLEL